MTVFAEAWLREEVWESRGAGRVVTHETNDWAVTKEPTADDMVVVLA